MADNVPETFSRTAKPPIKPTTLSFRPTEPAQVVSFPSKILPEEGPTKPTISGQGRVNLNVSSPIKPVTSPSTSDPGIPPKTVTSSLNLRSPLQGSRTPTKPPYPIYSKFGWAEHVYGSSARRYPDASPHACYPEFPMPSDQQGTCASTSKSPATTPTKGTSQGISGSSALPHPVPIGFEGLYNNNLQQYKQHRSISPVNENFRSPSSVPMSPMMGQRNFTDSPTSFGNVSVSSISRKKDSQRPSSGKRYSVDFNESIQPDPEYPEVYGRMAMSRRAIGGSLNTEGVGFGPTSLETEDRSSNINEPNRSSSGTASKFYIEVIFALSTKAFFKVLKVKCMYCILLT